MALIEGLLSSVCAMTPGNYNQACTKAADATSIQTGVKQTDAQQEDYWSKWGLKQSTEIVGEKTIYTMGTGVYLYKTYADKKVSVDLPKVWFCQSIHTELSPNSYGVQLKWTFK